MAALTPDQEKIGKENFTNALDAMTDKNKAGKENLPIRDGISRRDAMKAVAAGGLGLGATYFGYKELAADRVRVGFIGTGDEGSVLINEHPPAYMNIVAIADLRPSNRDRAFTGDPDNQAARAGLIKKLGADVAGKIERFENHRDLIAAKDRLGLEAVVIATPLVSHAPIALECMEAGLHVLTEKLMARTVTACKEMIRKAKAKNLLLAVGHQRHYSVLYDNANSLVQSGLLGDIRYIRAQWHRNNSFPGSDSWMKPIPTEDLEAIGLADPKAAGFDFKGKEYPVKLDLSKFSFENLEKLVNWRLYNKTGGGLMAELGSHQMDAASIFLGKVHPLTVQGFGGKIFYGIDHVGPSDKWEDKREIDDHIFVTFEFPGKTYDAKTNPNDKCVVTYSSINTNKFEPYGEIVYGTRGTLFMKTEKEAQLWKEDGKGSTGGGADQKLWVVNANAGGGSGPVLQAYETTSGPKAASGVNWAENVSRGYTEEMEHFCYAIRNLGPDYWPGGNPKPASEGGLRCNGVVAMADAIMALTANIAMAQQKKIEFKPEWFDPASDANPEADYKAEVTT